MFNDFKHLLNGEVLNWLQSSVLSAPRQRRSILAIGLELEKGIVNAIEEHLVVDVFALGQEIS